MFLETNELSVTVLLTCTISNIQSLVSTNTCCHIVPHVNLFVVINQISEGRKLANVFCVIRVKRRFVLSRIFQTKSSIINMK